MLIKKIYKDTDGAELDYISLANTGATPEQNFSVQLVTEGLNVGFMEIADDTLIFHVYPEDLHYTIQRRPGRYCLHCGEKLSDDTGGQLARLHVAEQHAGQASPSASDPAGYIAINAFQCVLNDAQHERFRVKEPARAPHFPVREQ